MKSPLFRLAPLLPAATYWVGCAAYTRMTGDPLGIGLGWNLILAALPLLFGRLALRCRSRVCAGFWWICWLLFLPNAFYFVTDLLHTPPGMEWLGEEAGETVVMHSEQFSHWLLLVLIGCGMFFAWLLGCLAVDCLFDLFRHRFGIAAAWTGIAVLSLACGAGIYIGRFLRLNSWDILRPAHLLRKLLAACSPGALHLVFLFAAAVLFSYGVLQSLRYALPRSDR